MVPETPPDTAYGGGNSNIYISTEVWGHRRHLVSHTYMNYRMRRRPWPRMDFVCQFIEKAKIQFQTLSPNSLMHLFVTLLLLFAKKWHVFSQFVT